MAAEPALPTVSVIMRLQGLAPHGDAAIDSVLAQTLGDLELIVIDERGVDAPRTPDDPRLRWARHEQEPGAMAGLRAGVALARGRYAALQDADAIAYPERLARQVAFLEAHPDHAAVSAWVDWIDASGRQSRIKRKPVAADEVAARMLFRSGLEHGASLARTEVLRQYLPAADTEFDLWARIAAGHKLANLPEILVRRYQPTGAADPVRRKAERRAIYRAQLSALGVAADEADLDRHFLLRRMRKERFAPDRIYVAWAEAWLRGLQAANAARHAYPEPVFSEVLGTYWVKVCWHAARGIGWLAAWRAFAASPLRRWSWPGLRRQIFRRRTGSF